LCDDRDYNAGVNQLRDRFGLPRVVEQSWTTFAHELGHNFAARHSFEDGQGRTGGIMDYGDGKLNGIYQFNTRYRKTEVCDHLATVKQTCSTFFKADDGATAPPTHAPTPAPPVAVQDCSFETGLCFWKQATNDNFNWDRRSGSTPSSGTGPDKAADKNSYLFIEASHPRRPNQKAILRSPHLMISQPTVMKFQYHMYGNNIGSLKVQVNGNELWSKTGPSENKWKQAEVDLSQLADSSPEIEFVGKRGNGWQGDVAIDMVSFEMKSPATPVPTPMPSTASSPVPTPMPTTASGAALVAPPAILEARGPLG